MSINFDRGFIRILISLSLPTIIISLIFLIIEVKKISYFVSDKWYRNYSFSIEIPIIILILYVLICILFFIIKYTIVPLILWIINGFKQK